MKKTLLRSIALIAILMAGSLGSGQGATTLLAATTATSDDEIVYLDANGCVKVYDPNSLAPNHQQIQFDSADFGECGWSHIATGDFNNDGDAEIVAVGTFNGSGRLVIYDPVVTDGSIPLKGTKNLVPYATLFDKVIPGSPITLLGAGNMNINVPGDEIIYGYQVSEAGGINARLEVLVATNPRGTAWTSHLNKAFGAAWTQVQVGNVNNVGSDDVVLIRTVTLNNITYSLLEAREIDNDFRTIYSSGERTDLTWNSAAIGQIYAGGPYEVVVTRGFPGFTPAATFFIFQYLDGTLKEAAGDAESFFPYPQQVFTGDINGNGDDEMFFLRSVPTGNLQARLVMRNRGGDLPGYAFELPLDADNGFQVGAAGDVDGDGKDEIVLIRSNKIRVYQSPDTNQVFDDYSFATNGRSLRLANLDGSGFVAGARFSVSPPVIEYSLQAGRADGPFDIFELQLTNTGSGGNIPFTAVIEGTHTWVSDPVVTSNTTPAAIRLKFDATQLTPGLYLGAKLMIYTTNPEVLNAPLTIPIALRVTPAPFNVSPTAVGVVYPPGADLSATRTHNLAISSSTAGIGYTAVIMPLPSVAAAQAAFDSVIRDAFVNPQGYLVLTDALGYPFNTGLQVPTQGEMGAAAIPWTSAMPWVAASSTSGTTPDTLTLTFRGDQLTGSAGRALLVVVGDERTGALGNGARFVPISLLAAARQFHMPTARK